MIKVANSEKVRSFIGSSKDIKPVNISASMSVGANFVADGITDRYTGPYIGQGSTFFELDTQDVYIYDEGIEAAADDDQWVKLNNSKVNVIINAK